MPARISIHIGDGHGIEAKHFGADNRTSYGSVSVEAPWPGENLTLFFERRSDALRLLSKLESLIHADTIDE